MPEVKEGYIRLLVELIGLGAKDGPVEATTKSLAERIGKSQQTLSLYLRRLEEEGLISRAREGRKSYVRLTRKGVDVLKSLYLKLKPYFEGVGGAVELEGRVFSGLGEGAYYMSREGYVRQFEEKLGFRPYPGTLNLKLDGVYVDVRRELEGLPSILIKGFRNEDRTYGWVRVMPALIGDVKGAVLLSFERGHYEEDVLEVISEFNLRERFGLKDGDLVRVKVLPKSG